MADHPAIIENCAALVARGFQSHQAGNLALAEAAYRQALTLLPGHADATRLLAETLIDQGRPADAAAMLQTQARRRHNDLKTQYSYANALRLSGNPASAAQAYQRILSRDPQFAGALHGLGTACNALGREQEAAKQFRRCTALRPDWAPAWRDLGLTLAILGDLPAAKDALKQARRLAPHMGDVARALAALCPAELDRAELTALAQNKNLPARERADMFFALGRVLDEEAAYDAAFDAFSAANSLVRQHIGGLDRTRLEADVTQLIAAFPKPAFTPISANETEQPVFILGMPRAGSSLFEHIAASHPQVHGAGELRLIGNAAAKLGALPGPNWTQDALAQAANSCLSDLHKRACNAERIIDKMPDNVFHLGLIAALFPKARIVFCQRDARDIALSCFFQNFSESLRFDTSLEDCAFRIAQTDRLMAHWRAVLPLRWTVMNYETLLAAPEAETRRFIAFLGLDWDPACLAFHETARPVRTASWSQIRRPLYTNAAGRWRNYASRLPGSLRQMDLASPNGERP